MRAYTQAHAQYVHALMHTKASVRAKVKRLCAPAPLAGGLAAFARGGVERAREGPHVVEGPAAAGAICVALDGILRERLLAATPRRDGALPHRGRVAGAEAMARRWRMNRGG